jgi:glycerophosphoryl diester phosphodiesterase
VFIQSFEMGNLEALHGRCEYPLVQLMSVDGGPWDRSGRDALESYAQLATGAGLQRIAGYASAIGVQKELVMIESGGRLVPTELVRHAHEAGLAVHVWTFRAENQFLPASLRHSSSPLGHGDLAAEIRAYADIGIDGLFSDFPDLARAALT